jgi:hypothetical protein
MKLTKLSRQHIVNHIANLVFNASLDTTEAMDVMGNTIGVYASLYRMQPKIPGLMNKLRGIDLEQEQPIKCFHTLIESSEEHIEHVQEKAINAALSSLRAEKKILDSEDCRTGLYRTQQAYNAAAEQLESIGYAVMDRKIIVSVVGEEKLSKFDQRIKALRDLEYCVDVREAIARYPDEEGDFVNASKTTVWYSKEKEMEVIALIDDEIGTNYIVSMENTPPLIPGCKDVEDFERKIIMRKELAGKFKQNDETGLSH